MFTDTIKTPFRTLKIIGKPYKIAYYLVGGSFRVPCVEVNEKGDLTGINTSAGFQTEKEALKFYNTGKPDFSIF